jgi:hypothetical protein
MPSLTLEQHNNTIGYQQRRMWLFSSIPCVQAIHLFIRENAHNNEHRADQLIEHAMPDSVQSTL